MFGSRGSSNSVKVRIADHAGSWYSDTPSVLRHELQTYWDYAASKLREHEVNGAKHARVIISPHAGYRFSGPTAGVAYRALDVNPRIKNIFVIGPSHHVYLTKAAISVCDQLDTPLGRLDVNRNICDELATNQSLFTTVSKQDEEAEHSLEMQYPFLKFAIDKVFTGDNVQAPAVIPIMVGNTNPDVERQLGETLAPYLKDASTLFIVSSDFAHWGKRFRYTYYLPEDASDPDRGINLKRDDQVPKDDTIHDSIERVDTLSLNAIKTGVHELFLRHLEQTGNTVCGRHPIGVMMCALQTLHKEFKLPESSSRFVFTDYTCSGLVQDVNDSSVSYASAYAKVECMDALGLIKHFDSILDAKHGVVNNVQYQDSELGVDASTNDDTPSEPAPSLLRISPSARQLTSPQARVPLRNLETMFYGSFGEYVKNYDQRMDRGWDDGGWNDSGWNDSGWNDSGWNDSGFDGSRGHEQDTSLRNEGTG